MESDTEYRSIACHSGHVGGMAQNNYLSLLVWAPADMGRQHYLMHPERLLAIQGYIQSNEHTLLL